jgi:two-component system response regulator RegA
LLVTVKHRKVLILEDEEASASLYAGVLRAAGFDVLVCKSFLDARACLKSEIPDGLLTDVRVGEYNGLQLVHLFRQLSPQGTVVVATGHDDPTIRVEAERMGAIFIVKPLDVSSLASYFE